MSGSRTSNGKCMATSSSFALPTEKTRREYDRTGPSATGRQASVAAARSTAGSRPSSSTGTARQFPIGSADAGELRALVEELCASGLDLVVVTGTHVGNVDEQLRARPEGPGRLYFCVNRGSEVYAVNEHGVELLERRKATPDEEAMLDAAAVATVAELGRRGLVAEVVASGSTGARST